MDCGRRAKNKKKQAANGPRRVLRNEAKHRNTIFYVSPYQHFKVFFCVGRSTSNGESSPTRHTRPHKSRPGNNPTAQTGSGTRGPGSRVALNSQPRNPWASESAASPRRARRKAFHEPLPRAFCETNPRHYYVPPYQHVKSHLADRRVGSGRLRMKNHRRSDGRQPGTLKRPPNPAQVIFAKQTQDERNLRHINSLGEIGKEPSMLVAYRGWK